VAEALEERSTQEVVDRNLAIEALKKEMDILEAEKTRLAVEVGGSAPPKLSWGSFRRRLTC